MLNVNTLPNRKDRNFKVSKTTTKTKDEDERRRRKTKTKDEDGVDRKERKKVENVKSKQMC